MAVNVELSLPDGRAASQRLEPDSRWYLDVYQGKNTTPFFRIQGINSEVEALRIAANLEAANLGIVAVRHVDAYDSSVIQPAIEAIIVLAVASSISAAALKVDGSLSVAQGPRVFAYTPAAGATEISDLPSQEGSFRVYDVSNCSQTEVHQFIVQVANTSGGSPDSAIALFAWNGSNVILAGDALGTPDSATLDQATTSDFHITTPSLPSNAIRIEFTRSAVTDTTLDPGATWETVAPSTDLGTYSGVAGDTQYVRIRAIGPQSNSPTYSPVTSIALPLE